MELRRTANAGVLLTLDNVKILLDGVCREVKPYLATPPAEKEKLLSSWPDGVFFTHFHEDHFDPAYAGDYCKATGRPIYGTPQMSGTVCTDETVTVGNIRLTAVTTRHMGHYGKTTIHRSYVAEGSKVIWFLGDASPMELKKLSGHPKPDLLIVPYPYVSTPPALKLLEELLPCKIVLLHLPSVSCDPDGVWQAAASGMEHLKSYLYVPQLGETLQF